MATLVAISNQTLTVSSAAVSLTVPGQTTSALITVENASIRWWDDGTNPTATAGHLATSGTQIIYSDIGQDSLIKNFKAIRADTPDATIQVSYYIFRGV